MNGYQCILVAYSSDIGARRGREKRGLTWKVKGPRVSHSATRIPSSIVSAASVFPRPERPTTGNVPPRIVAVSMASALDTSFSRVDAGSQQKVVYGIRLMRTPARDR